ncbi:DDE_3 domain-containing protein [Trichonephila clavipes]|nr:DDE_3 domain-containing protein [Trichonephila clavipes]
MGVTNWKNTRNLESPRVSSSDDNDSKMMAMIARFGKGIILNSRTDLRVNITTMIGQIYRDVVPEQHVRLFRGAMRAEFVFMDDTSHPDHANIVSECLLSKNVTLLD